MPSLSRAMRLSPALLTLALFVCAGFPASAGAKGSSAPAKSSPAPAAKSSGGSSASHSSGGSASHSGTTGSSASHSGTSGSSPSHSGTSGPSANHPSANGPSANHPAASGPSANHPGPGGPSANHPSGPSANGPAVGRPASSGMARPGGGANAEQRSGVGGPARNNAIAHPAPRNSMDHNTRDGSAVRTRSNGRVSDVHDAKRGMDVHHGLDGSRRSSVERGDHSRVVSERGRPGYVQRPYGFHGHDFARRSYFYHGHAYNHFYHGYGYRGMYLNVYAPGFYYGPGFYGWAYNPWAAPITFGWGWGGSPWYSYYGGYFAPYPTYPSASYWLTDYMISTDLQASYAAHQEAGGVAGTPVAAGGPPALTPEVKQMIADEVRNQLALENQEAQQNAHQQDIDPNSSGIGRMMTDGHPHVFVVGGSLDVVNATGTECSVSDGDALSLGTMPPANATEVDLQVLSSKGGQECAKSSIVKVQLTDLQEMQNHMRETIDQGLQELQAKQGKGGLPVAPPSAQVQPAPALYASAAPPAETNVAAEIQQQTQQADQSEAEVTAQASQETGVPIAAAAPAPPASIGVGQSADEVKAALGSPAKVADLGNKVIFYYSGMKVTFKEGKVIDVQ